jgi:uroporphyrinogen decarboxylase
MDMAKLKKNYGDRLTFHGGVDNQKVLPYGTAQEVREEVLNCMATLGKNQEGYICCSCHNIQPGTPFENILTLIDTVKNSSALI